jgi:hypothetical protein
MHGAIFRDRVRGGNKFRRQTLYKSKTDAGLGGNLMIEAKFRQFRSCLFRMAQ